MHLFTRLQRSFLRHAASLPVPLLRRIVGPEVRSPDGDVLAPEQQLILRGAKVVGRKEFHELSVSAARKQMEESLKTVDYSSLRAHLKVRASDRTVPGPQGEIPLRIYRPARQKGPLPVLVYFHGGGFMIGSVEAYDGVCRTLSMKANAIVVSVSYRLAPEHKFPAAPVDAVAATRWVLANAYSFGGDARAVAVGGDSAGGNLAAVVALETKSDALRPMFQLLIYPATDMTCQSPSHACFDSGYLLPKGDVDWFTHGYLTHEREKKDPRASPLFADDLRGLPPAHVQTAGFDPLRDEGRAYAEKMRHAGVRVEYQCEGGAMHGYFSFGGVFKQADRAVEDAARALSRAFADAIHPPA